jgi:hypothetical protein
MVPPGDQLQKYCSERCYETALSDEDKEVGDWCSRFNDGMRLLGDDFGEFNADEAATSQDEYLRYIPQVRQEEPYHWHIENDERLKD